MDVTGPVARGIYWGLGLAFVQALLSVLSMYWAWEKKSFFVVWGVGMLARFVVAGLVAFVVYRYTELNLVATLITLITATTLFLVIESTLIFPKK